MKKTSPGGAGLCGWYDIAALQDAVCAGAAISGRTGRTA